VAVVAVVVVELVVGVFEVQLFEILESLIKEVLGY